MTTRQLAAIRAALESLPAQCRYHGENTGPPDGSLLWREACCDTGIPARRRSTSGSAAESTRSAPSKFLSPSAPHRVPVTKSRSTSTSTRPSSVGGWRERCEPLLTNWKT